MPTARAVFQLHIDGLTAGNLTPLSVPVTVAWTFEDAAGDIDLIDLPTGLTTLTRPPKATMLIVIPPPTNVTPLAMKANSGDPTGVALSPNCGTILALAPGPTALQTTTAIPGVRIVWV